MDAACLLRLQHCGQFMATASVAVRLQACPSCGRASNSGGGSPWENPSARDPTPSSSTTPPATYAIQGSNPRLADPSQTGSQACLVCYSHVCASPWTADDGRATGSRAGRHHRRAPPLRHRRRLGRDPALRGGRPGARRICVAAHSYGCSSGRRLSRSCHVVTVHDEVSLLSTKEEIRHDENEHISTKPPLRATLGSVMRS